MDSGKSNKNYREQIECIDAQIRIHNNAIEKLLSRKRDVEKTMHDKCEHYFIKDRYANYDDICKFVCTHCGLYENMTR
tara:strand:+ start:196 stop:429 length:234 start_codon:yes stop_codon:yes gene_type:complete